MCHKGPDVLAETHFHTGHTFSKGIRPTQNHTTLPVSHTPCPDITYIVYKYLIPLLSSLDLNYDLAPCLCSLNTHIMIWIPLGEMWTICEPWLTCPNYAGFLFHDKDWSKWLFLKLFSVFLFKAVPVLVTPGYIPQEWKPVCTLLQCHRSKHITLSKNLKWCTSVTSYIIIS